MAKKATTSLFESQDTKEKALDTQDIIDVAIPEIRRQRFRINGDNNKIVELNTSDLNIGTRLQTAYTRLGELIDEVVKTIPDSTDTPEEIEAATSALDELDKLMREQIDYLFDYPVSEVCADGGSMWDPYDGMFRYEHIISRLIKLYESNMDSEFTKIRNRVNEEMATKRKAVSKYHK